MHVFVMFCSLVVSPLSALMSSVRLSCFGKKKNRTPMLLWDGWYFLYWQSQLEVISSMIRTMISLLWQIDSILKIILFQTAGCVKVEVVVSHFSLCCNYLGKNHSESFLFKVKIAKSVINLWRMAVSMEFYLLLEIFLNNWTVEY